MCISARRTLPLFMTAAMHIVSGMVPRIFGSLSALQQSPYRAYSSLGAQLISSPVPLTVQPIQGTVLCFASSNPGNEGAKSPPALWTFTVKELQNLCRAAKLPVGGRKAELIARLEQSSPESAVEKIDGLPNSEENDVAGLRGVVILACKS